MNILTKIKEYAAKAVSAVKSNPSYFASILAGLFVLCAMAYAASRMSAPVLTAPRTVINMDASSVGTDASFDVFDAFTQG